MLSQPPRDNRSLRRVSTDPAKSTAMDLVSNYVLELQEEQAINPTNVDRLQSSLVRRHMRLEYIDRLERMYKPSVYTDSQALERNLGELRAAQQDFMKTLPTQEREDLSSQPFTRDQVLKVVENAIAESDKSRFSGVTGKVKQYFHTICSSIDNHSKPLEMLPGSSMYCSLFYGGLLTVLHASVNYQAISKSVPEAIAEINTALSGIDKQVWLYPTETIKLLVQRIYTEIFRFLAEVMKWYSSKKRRLMGAFNEGLHDDLKGYLASVLQTAGYIKEEARCGLSAEVRHLRMSVEELNLRNEMMADVLVSEARERKNVLRICGEMCETQRRAETERRKQLEAQKSTIADNLVTKLLEYWKPNSDTIATEELIGAPAARMMLGDAEMYLAERRRAEASVTPDSSQSSDLSSASRSVVDVTDTVPMPGRSTLMEWGKHLEGFFEESQLQPERNDATAFFAETEALVGLQTWLSNENSCCTYVRYPASMSTVSSSSTMLATHLVSILREQHVPVISYFCAEFLDFGSAVSLQQENAVMRMVYALAWQLLNNLPAEMAVEDAKVFDSSRFQELRSGTESFDPALTLLDDLLRRSHHPLLFLVVDGLDSIEDLPRNPSEVSTDQQRVRQVVSVLQAHRDRCQEVDGSAETFKVLFTTNGSCLTLMEALNEKEIIFVSQRPGPRRPGRPSRGAQPFGHFSGF